MNHYWSLLNERFEALNSREKVLVNVCGIIVLVLLLFVYLVEPSMISSKKAQKMVAETQVANQLKEGEILALQGRLARNPDRDIDLELEQLTKENQELSVALSEVVGSLVSPSQMSELLEQVLVSSQELKLVSLESMTAEAIKNNNNESSDSGYYIHPVRLELTGNYFAVVDFLSALEALPVKYYWRSFKYSVETYPQARVILEVYTVGIKQEFIGG